MAYIEGPMASANPGTDLYNLIEAQALATGWTLVDTVVIGATTHKVLRSDGAGNAMGKTWYLDISFPATGVATKFMFCPFEDYNATTHIAYRGPRTGSSDTTIESTYYSRYGATGSALESNWVNTQSYSGFNQTLVASAFNYYISITRNRIIMMTTTTGTSMYYAGFYIPAADHLAHTGPDCFPLISLRVGNQGTGYSSTNGANVGTAAITRAPKYTTNFNWGSSVAYNAYYYQFANGVIGTGPSPGNGKLLVAPISITLAMPNGVPGNNTLLTFAGYLDGVANGMVIDTALRGDYVTIGADRWILLTPNGNVTSMFQAV